MCQKTAPTWIFIKLLKEVKTFSAQSVVMMVTTEEIRLSLKITKNDPLTLREMSPRCLPAAFSRMSMWVLPYGGKCCVTTKHAHTHTAALRAVVGCVWDQLWIIGSPRDIISH